MEVNGEIPMDGYDSQSMAPLKQIISDFASAMSSDNITTVSYTHLDVYKRQQ